MLSTSFSNTICYLAFGKRFDHSDPKFLHLLDFVNKHLSDRKIVTVAMLPILKRIPGDPFGAVARKQRMIEMREFLGEIIKEHRQTFDDQCIRDYIDAFIAVQRQEHAEDSTFTGRIT